MSGSPVEGSYDFEFALFDGGGSQLGATLTRNGVVVTNGVFSVNLDFGSVFPGANRLLEIRVRQSGGGSFTALSPRQSVTSSPYSVKSLNADTATNFTGALAGDVAGTQGATTVARLRGRNVSPTAPTTGQVLKYNAGTSQWEPATDETASGGSGLTGVTAGTGLTGGGTTGTVTVGIANSGVGTTQLADSSVTDAKIVSVGGAKVTGTVAAATNATQLNSQPATFYQNATNLNAGTLNVARLPNPFQLAGSAAGANSGIITATNTNTIGYGMFGYANADSGTTAGVFGRSNSTAGRGVEGLAGADTGFTYGLYGLSLSTDGFGAFGWATATTGVTRGVFGQSASTDGTGVFGWATAATGTTFGVYGRATSTNGYGGYFQGRGYFSENVGIGVTAPADKLDVNGIIRVSTLGSAGATALCRNASNQIATCSSSGGSGITGVTAGTGLTGGGTTGTVNVAISDGGVGTTQLADGSVTDAKIVSVNAAKVTGTLDAARLPVPLNLSGVAGVTNGVGIISATNPAFGGRGVVGIASGASGSTFGGEFESASTSGIGVSGSATAAGGITYGGRFQSSSVNGIGVAATNSSPTGYGGFFTGRGYFSGSLGIGQTNPSATLTVSSSTASNLENTATFKAPNIGANASHIHYGTAGDWYVRSAASTGTVILQDTGGNVGIGTTAPDSRLTVNGTASKPGGGSWATFSDERLKNVGKHFTPGLKAVMQLQPLTYQYKADNVLGIKSDGDHIGFSAQSIERVIPEAVTMNEQGYRLVNNDPIMWTMLNAIKEQQAQIAEQKKLITELLKSNTALKTRVKTVENGLRRKSGSIRPRGR